MNIAYKAYQSPEKPEGNGLLVVIVLVTFCKNYFSCFSSAEQSDGFSIFCE